MGVPQVKPHKTIAALRDSIEMDIDAFKRNLAATLAWCRPRFDVDHPKDSLRSAELRCKTIETDDLIAIHRTVDSVVKSRASFVGPTELNLTNIDGRLLAFHPRQSLSDGFCEIESNGFIDSTDAPPWDTWIYMIDDLLISWVPSAAIDRVNAAIICNVEESLMWLSDVTDEAAVSELRDNNLLW